MGGEYQDFRSKIFCLSAEIFRRESLLCFRSFRASEHFMRKRGLSRFPKENLLSHRTEKLRRANLLCLTKFLVPKKFMDKSGRGDRRREYHHFPSKVFCLTVPKFRFVGESF